MRNTLVGSTLDPSRVMGPYESKATEILGEPLNHSRRSINDRDHRDEQQRKLYEDHGWSLEDIAIAYGVSRETVRTNVKRMGGEMRAQWRAKNTYFPG